MKKNFLKTVKRALTTVLMTVVAAFGFSACDNNDDEEELSQSSTEETGFIYSDFTVSESLLEFADLYMTYTINGQETKKKIDISSAVSTLEMSGFSCKKFSIKEKLTDRPLKITITAEPKEDIANIISAKLQANIQEVSFYTNGTIDDFQTRDILNERFINNLIIENLPIFFEEIGCEIVENEFIK